MIFHVVLQQLIKFAADTKRCALRGNSCASCVS